jgi:energy-coupling factor transport system ATP-binding protein
MTVGPAMPMAPRLAMLRAGYTYAGTSRPSIAEINLEVGAGRVLAVVGPNEAGKSTLCLVAAGLAPGVVGGRLTGSVRLQGVETSDLRPHELAQRCGILFQNPATQRSGTAQTVFEEVAFGPRNLGLSVAEVATRVNKAVATVGIGDLVDRDPGRLSGGQAQLLALASILAMEPATLVLDEPTSELDPAGTRLVGEALSRLSRETGTAILIVEHKTGLLARMADEAVVLAGGAIVRRGSAAEVLNDPALTELGVEAPPLARLRLAAAAAGVERKLEGLDLEAMDLEFLFGAS